MNSVWLDSVNRFDNLGSLNEDVEADICIIGAGIFGATCAYYLSKLGYKTIVLEKDDIATKTTAFTTGKITSQHGLFYSYLMKTFGLSFAKNYFDSNEEAINNIVNIIEDEKINCDLELQNNYVYTASASSIPAIEEEISAVQSLGGSCEFTTTTSFPFKIKGAACFKNQAQFNPLKYVHALCQKSIDRGTTFYINTVATNIEKHGELYQTFANNHIITSKYVIVASHYPFMKLPGFYFSKMYQSTSYIIAIDAKKTLPNGMYICSDVPHFSFRTAKFNGKRILLIGGFEHKTGLHISYKDSYGALENEAKSLYPECEVLYKWSTEDCISLDKVPYIGSYSPTLPNVFVGTGFKKWGMTLSNVAANIIVDKIQNVDNKYAEIYCSSRFDAFKNFKEFKNMMVQSANSLIFNKLKPSEEDFEEIPNDSGGIIQINKEKVGIYKDVNGKVFAVKPICTHLGCLLSWNDVDKTWDCPCHGSRYDFSGKNIYNPAFDDLETYDIN